MTRSTQAPLSRMTAILLALLAATPLTARGQQGFCLADANGDGHPLFGNPEVMLNPFDDLLGFTSTLPTWGALGDLDGDGDLDAVATYAREHPIDAEQSSLVVLLNAGDGVFHSDARYECGDYPGSVAIGDLDGDGLNDLAVTNTYSGQVSVLINAGGGHFPTHVGYFSGGLPRSVVIADLNGDGLPDLAVLNVGTDDIAIFLNSGSGTFTHLANYPALNIPEELIDFDYYSFGGPQLSAGDVDGDGDVDLVTPGVFPNGLYGLAVMFNNGHAGFTTPVFHATGGFSWSSALGDLDGDGDLDLVAPNPTSETSTIAVLLNPGTGNFAPHTDYSVEYAGPCGCYNPRSLAMGDLDGDGNLDVAVGLFGYDVVVLAGAGNGTLGAPLRYAVAPDPRVVALGDVNGDGHLDLAALTFGYAEDKLAIRMNDGTGTLITDGAYPDSLALSGPTDWPNTYQIAFVDIDSDADLDVVVLN
ncbi:MAG TPA: VCBS repeat-containing protein, partial [Phycisphaerae bacterium]